MRKLFLTVSSIIFIFCLSACKNKVNCSMYISSVGFELAEEQMKITFLANPLADLSRVQGENSEQDIFEIEETQLTKAFTKVRKSLLSPINFKHIKTMVFSKDFLESKYLEEYFNYIAEERDLTFNFYVFATDEKMKDIYSFKNPYPISYQYSILSSPELTDYHDAGTEKLHFLEFANNYANGHRYIHIPYLRIDDKWKEQITLCVGGFYTCGKQSNQYSIDSYAALPFLYDQDYYVFEYRNKYVTILNYQIKGQVFNDKYTLVIRFQLENVDAALKGEVEAVIIDLLQGFCDAYIQKEGSLYFIDFYNYQNQKNINPVKYAILII